VRLAGKSAIITGAGSGIGRAIAKAFAAEGARVAVVDVVAPGAEEVAREIAGAGATARAFITDISDEKAVRAMIDGVAGAFGSVDVLCNNAALDHPIVQTDAMPTETFDRVLAVNARGPFLCAKHALPLMLKAGRGAIINVASDLGYLAVPGLGAYCISKGALLQLTRVLAAEYSQRGIRANAICPTMVDTPMARRAVGSHPDPSAWMREVERSIPMGRIGQPDEIARIAVFLASDDASFMTGSIVAADGGRSAV
jgi:NAD(P)-dependent dehydrogenase (short-subunit alcohol dehydrogenase family)